MRHFLTLGDLKPEELELLIDKSIEVKKSPERFSDALKDKTLLMVFAKPSLRTRVSFETGMTQLGGHGIYYDVSTSPMGKKESVADTAKTVSRYVDVVMARLFEHPQIEEFAANSSVPVINALTDSFHPCQVVADLQSVKEKFGKLAGLKLAFLGDGHTNMPNSLLLGCTLAGISISIGCPQGEKFEPFPETVEKAKKSASENNSSVEVLHKAEEAVKDADIVCTDSWMSYNIPENEKEERVKAFRPFQVNAELMGKAKPSAVFMHCLPAQRGMEVTNEVIDGKQSIVFDEAENRLHSQKAIMLWLLGKI